MYQLYSNSNIHTDSILTKTLQNRGIKEIERFLNPSEESLIHYSKLKNIEAAIELFNKHIQNNSNIATLTDADIDGNTSNAALTSYIRKNFPQLNLQVLFHKGKQHGLTEPIMQEIKQIHKNTPIGLLIMPDASSNDYEEHKELSELGIDILVLDHHECEKESEFAVVVNSQLSDEYTNKQLSGVGIVYKFLQACDDKFGLNDADNYLDLVAVGNIGDAMNLIEPETRYLVYKGLSRIKNEFLIEMIKKNFSDVVKDIHPHGLSFNVLPKANAIIRIGSQEEKELMFRAFCGEIEDSTRTWRGRVIKETLAQKVTRLATNAHKRQKTLREKWVAILTKQINQENLDENAFIVLKVQEIFDRELTGYLASGLINVYKKPVLLMAWNEEEEAYTGSLRGYDGAVKDTKSFLNELGLFNFVSGHPQAAGLSISEENLKILNEKINQKLDFTNGNEPIMVDFILGEQNITPRLVEEVADLDKYWGKGVEQPLFAVVNAEIEVSKIKASNRSTMLKWFKNGIEYIQFTGDEKLLELLDENKTVKADLIGKMSTNEFQGKITKQFIIETIDILEINDNKSIGFDVSNLF